MRANPIQALTIFGIAVIWLLNLPVFLFRLLKALFRGRKLPPVITIFYIPKVNDNWLAVIGLVAILLTFSVTAYLPSTKH